ncbi:MAG: BCCT family transporter [Paracoccus sp. (in: a-proteobacteria)]|uniref:BCCT family transporter n=1 Tax=Paracoccus sp. TaxID=267 RepID=UPI004059251C
MPATCYFWYVCTSAFFVVLCILLALTPALGRLQLGEPGEWPKFSNFSWFSMMFGARFGVRMLTCATSELISQFQTNRDVIQVQVAGACSKQCDRLNVVVPALGPDALGLLCAEWACAGHFVVSLLSAADDPHGACIALWRAS